MDTPPDNYRQIGLEPYTAKQAQALLDRVCYQHNARIDFDTTRLVWVVEHTYGDVRGVFQIPVYPLTHDAMVEMTASIHYGRKPDALSPA